MYCSACGTAVNKDLNFCKNCGARLGDKKESAGNQLSEASVNFLIAALLGIPIAGIGIIIGLMSVMKKELGFPNDLIGIVVLMSFLMLLLAEAGCIWILWSRTRIPRQTAVKKNELKEAAKKELVEPRDEPISQPASSVTENTTRSFEPVYRDPKGR